MPEYLRGLIAKHYLFDGRYEPRSAEYQAVFAMEDYLNSLGLKTASERLFGIVGLRNAAMKAGLGVIRNNNFFYTESGSWVNLVTWLTDRDMTLVHTPSAPALSGELPAVRQGLPDRGTVVAAHALTARLCVLYDKPHGGRRHAHDAQGALRQVPLRLRRLSGGLPHEQGQIEGN